MKKCSVDSCLAASRRRGWCHLHYTRWYRGKSLTDEPIKNRSAYERMIAHGIERRGECLLFTGMTNTYGYGAVKDSTSALPSRKDGAHRISYQKWHGDIPMGMHIDHTCHNQAFLDGTCPGGVDCYHRRCINPGHLEAKTIQENLEAPKLARIPAGESVCRIIGCGSDWKMMKGYCVKHYARAYRNGNPFTWKSGSRGGRVNLEIHELKGRR